MGWLVLSYVMAAGLALSLGIWLGSGTRVASRRRSALRWAFESASSEADRARHQEAEARTQLMAARQAEARARAELEAARAREAAARNEAEDSRALAAMIEAEMVAARWEKEEIEQRARTVHAQLEERARGVAALHAALANLHYMCDRYDQQLLAALQAADVARAIGDRRALAAAEKERGLALLNLGRVAQARAVLQEAATLAEAANDLWTLCYALRGLSVVHTARGEFDQGYHAADRAMECALLSGAPTMMALAAQRRGTVAYFMGQWDQARADAEHAAELLGQVGPSFTRLYPLLTLGKLSLSQGQWDAAQTQLQEAIALAERSGNLYGLRTAHAALAERDVLEHAPDAARSRLEPLLDRPGQQEGDVTVLLAQLAWAYVDLGEERQAEDFLAQSEARAAPEAMRATLVDMLRVRALLALRRRRWRAAEAALIEAVALAQAIAYPYAEAKALFTYGLLHLQRGQPKRARTRLVSALAIFNRLGERLYADHAERALAALSARSA